jgi:hypothetical protein
MKKISGKLPARARQRQTGLEARLNAALASPDSPQETGIVGGAEAP